MISDGEKVAQDLIFLFKTQVEEDMFHPFFGMDFNAVVESTTPEIVVETIILQALLEYEYVADIVTLRILDIDSVERHVTVELVLKFEEELLTTVVVI